MAIDFEFSGELFAKNTGNVIKSNDEFMIKVWRFDDAPKEYRDLSDFAGDEDWVAFVPESLKNEDIWWMTSGSAFGCFEVSEHIVDGGIVRIGCHS